jgi:hypothetical protein
MKTESFYYLAAAALIGAWMLAPVKTQAAKNHNLSVSSDGNAEHCSDLKVTSNNGEVARANDAYTLQKSEAPILEMTGMEKSVIQVRGWDRSEYSVETCKVAAADNRAIAEQGLRGISVTRSAGRISATGPASDDVNWELFFFVHAPKDANLNLETKNGPISVSGISGTLKARAANGPISVSNSSGLIEIHSSNGPISFNGGGGEVHLIANNGPISLNLEGDVWNGSQLEARTTNGPLSLGLPETFRSGVRIETGGNAPVSCRVNACREGWTNTGSNQRVMQINGSQDTIKITTNNGPVSIGSSKKGRVL